jgi:hypothetical protein
LLRNAYEPRSPHARAAADGPANADFFNPQQPLCTPLTSGCELSPHKLHNSSNTILKSLRDAWVGLIKLLALGVASSMVALPSPAARSVCRVQCNINHLNQTLYRDPDQAGTCCMGPVAVHHHCIGIEYSHCLAHIRDSPACSWDGSFTLLAGVGVDILCGLLLTPDELCTVCFTDGTVTATQWSFGGRESFRTGVDRKQCMKLHSGSTAPAGMCTVLPNPAHMCPVSMSTECIRANCSSKFSIALISISVPALLRSALTRPCVGHRPTFDTTNEPLIYSSVNIS